MGENSQGTDRKKPRVSEYEGNDQKSADLLSVDSLDEKSDFSVFLSSKVSEALHQRALRKLFHLPLFHQRDGLDDYDDDFRSFKSIGDMITAHTRHQMERLARNSGDSVQDAANRIEAQSSIPLPKTAQGGEEGTESSEARTNLRLQEQKTAGTTPLPSPPNRHLHSNDQCARSTSRSDPLVTFRSLGHLVVIGECDRACAIAAELADRLPCTLIVYPPTEGEVSGSREKLQAPEGVRILQGTSVEVKGYLGMFEITFCEAAGVEHAERRRLERADLVLDLTTPPLLSQELFPPGYQAPGEDFQALQRALEELPDLVGEFEKPRFVLYYPSRCAHGNSKVHGCRKCIEVCPTRAISSGKSSISIHDHLCQGCLICATACPTAAITESSSATRDRVKQMTADLRHHHTNRTEAPCVLLHDVDMNEADLACLQSAPRPVVSFRLEQIGSIGMDIWFALLAGGASQVILWSKETTPSSLLWELKLQKSYAETILAGMGYEPQRLQFIMGSGRVEQLVNVLKALKPGSEISPTFFPDLTEKRAVIKRAIQHLYEQATSPHSLVDLPEGAPFGGIDIDPSRCTLCMACATVCPVLAVRGSDSGNQLLFFESECVQCGLCQESCPEQAITLIPRLRYQGQTQGHVLHQEEPFNCVCCGAPFATKKMVAKLTEKLTVHWMFQDDAARKRLQMCKECRLQDIFSRKETILVHR